MNSADRLLVVAATRAELGHLAESESDHPGAGGPGTWQTWSRPGITAATCGLGKANAAARCASILNVETFALVLHVGIAGATGERSMRPGSLFLADFDVDADLGFRGPVGMRDLESMGPEFFSVPPHHNRLPTNAEATEAAFNILSGAGHRPLRRGFHTSDTVSATVRMASGRCERLQTAAESMEGSGVLTACLRMNVPCVELRSMSNPMGIRDKDRWDLPVAFTALDQALGDLCAAWPWSR